MLEIISEKIVFNIFFLISRLLLDYSLLERKIRYQIVMNFSKQINFSRLLKIEFFRIKNITINYNYN